MKNWLINNWRTAAIWTWLLIFMWGLQLTIVYKTMPETAASGLRFIGG